MTTVINNAGPATGGEGSNTGVIVGILVAVVIILTFFIWGWPAIRGNQTPEPSSVKINIPNPIAPSTNSGTNNSGY